MPVIGQTEDELVTVPLPPPMVCMPEPPSQPMTAMDFVLLASGRMPFLFLSRTMPSSAPRSATAVAVALVVTAVVLAVDVLPMIPNAKSWVSTRETIALTWATVTWC
jgi:hypothetical protein